MKRKLLVLLSIFFVAAGLLFSGVAYVHATGDKGKSRFSLSGGRRRAKVKLDYKSVNFPHKKHQDLVATKLKKDCKFCHHRKREGRDPRACRRCHAGRQVKSKGGLDREGYLSGKVRPGKLMKMKDVFHIVCRGCHEKMREEDIDLNSMGDEGAPLNCEGCHNPKDEDGGGEEEEE